jgi:hypothetical protein
MTIAHKVDSTGDLVLDERKRMTVISGTEKAMQDVAVILRSLKGSLPFNTGFGTDHIAIVESERNLAVAKHEIQTALASYAGWKSLDPVVCTFDDNRHLVVAVSGILTTGDEIFLEETL